MTSDVFRTLRSHCVDRQDTQHPRLTEPPHPLDALLETASALEALLKDAVPLGLDADTAFEVALTVSRARDAATAVSSTNDRPTATLPPSSIGVWVPFGPDDLQMIGTIRAYVDRHHRSPKQREVLRCLDSDRQGTRGRKTFARLVLIGAIVHSRNGHCWLTDAADQALPRPAEPQTFSIFGQIEAAAAEHMIEQGQITRIPRERIPASAAVNEAGMAALFAVLVPADKIDRFNRLIADLRA
jgi:hypothetical protein